MGMGDEVGRIRDNLRWQNDSVVAYPKGALFLNGSTSQLIYTGRCLFLGAFVDAASSTPTIKTWDNTAASGTIDQNTFTPTASGSYLTPPNPAEHQIGLYITVSGTVGYTVYYIPLA